MTIEHRTLTLELRASAPKADGSIGTLEGYAAVFNQRSELLGWFFEELAPGSFDTVLTNDVRALINHDAGSVIGRTSSKTLRLAVDATGLRYSVDLPDTTEARDLLTSVKRGDIRESSFGFEVASNGDTWDINDQGQTVRTITKVGRLYDVSPVAFPAYPAATVAMRSLFERAQRQQAPGGTSNAAELAALTARVEALGQRFDELAARAQNAAMLQRIRR